MVMTVLAWKLFGLAVALAGIDAGLYYGVF